MKWISCTFALILCTLTLSGQAGHDPFERILSPDEMAEDLRILQTSLEGLHPGLYTYTTAEDFARYWQQMHAACEEPMTEMAFYRQLGPILEVIGDVHTDLEPSPAFYERLNREWPVFPLSVIWLEEQLYVSHNLSTEEGIYAGDQLLRINGRPADSLFHELSRYVPRDGRNLTSPHHVLGGLYGGFRNYYASLYGVPATFEVVVSREGQESTLLVEGIPYADLFARGEARYPGRSGKQAQLQLSIEGRTAILQVSSFHPGKIRNNGQRYRRFFAKAFRSIAKAGVENLILDVRGNGGGHQSVFMELFSYLHPHPFTAYRELSTITTSVPNPSYFTDPEAIAEMEGAAANLEPTTNGRFLLEGEAGLAPFAPQQPSFTGSLAVLIDGASSSATGDFAGLLREHERAIFIGEELGGNSCRNSAGTTLTLELPHSHINVIIPSLLYVIATDVPNDGHGIIPEHVVPVTVEDYLNGRDPVMTFTRELIETGQF